MCSQLKIHLLYNPATMATSPAIPPMMFGNKCFINGVDVTPTCSGGTACQDSGGTTLSIVSQNDQRTDYSPPLDYGVPAYEFTFDVSAAASLPAFPAGGLCIYCDIMDVPSFGWHMPCTGKLEDGSLIPAGCDPAAQEAVPPSGFRASYSLASVFGTNSLSNVVRNGSCSARRRT